MFPELLNPVAVNAIPSSSCSLSLHIRPNACSRIPRPCRPSPILWHRIAGFFTESLAHAIDPNGTPIAQPSSNVVLQVVLGRDLTRLGANASTIAAIKTVPRVARMVGPYRFGSITIDQKEYHSDVIVYPDRIDDRWCRKEGHRLSIDDLRDVLSEQPDTLVVGTGYFGRMGIDDEVIETLKAKGITLFAQKTSKACAAFNHLRETGKVVAALHLTC